jgi:transposase
LDADENGWIGFALLPFCGNCALDHAQRRPVAGFASRPETLEKAAEAVIPSHKNCKKPREYDPQVYKERHLVECFFNKSTTSDSSPVLQNWTNAIPDLCLLPGGSSAQAEMSTEPRTGTRQRVALPA